MNRLLYLFLSLVVSTGAFAQTVSFSLTTAPCNNDGVLTANFTGLTPPITVNWHTSGATATTITHTITGLTDALTSYSGGGLYVTATDGSSTAYGMYAGAPPFMFSVATIPGACPVLGSATVTVSGGTSPYTYSWFNTSTMSTVGTTNPISLPTGSYGVTITDAAGCVYGSLVDDSGSAYIYSMAAYSVSTTTTPANCTNGTAAVVPGSGGTAPYSYLWSTGATTSSITGLIMGTYTVMVTDAIGCSAMGWASVSQSITINTPITPTPATCTNADGAVIVFGAGGTPPYTYLWSNGATTASQTGLASGSYGVTVTDANGCWGSGNTYINTSTPVTVTFSSSPSLCTSPTGNATLTPAGGTAPYTYLWYTTPVQTTSTATSLAPGMYNFKVTDAVGCTRTGIVTVAPVSVINGSFLGTSPLCTTSTGAVALTASGGVTPYTYVWNTGATTSSITGVPAGYYSVTITDAMSCHVTKGYPLSSHSPLTTALSSTPASCIFANDGSMTLAVTGGTTPYTYSWTSGGTTATVSGLGTGNYWVHVTDATGCTANNYNYLGYNAAGTSCYCTISGTVYNDLNGNCTQDSGEPGIQHIQIYCSGIGYTYTDATGHYSFKVPSGSYTISEAVSTIYPLSSCQLNNIPVTASASSGCVLPVNFANSVATIHDMHIATWDYSMAVPGNTYTQITLIENNGTVTESAPLASYKPDGQLLAPSFVPTTLFSGSPYYYNTGSALLSMTPGGSQTVYANYLVPTDIPLGTSVVFKDSTANVAPMSNWLTDYSPWDNVDFTIANVVGSFDPNFKEVSPKGIGPNGNITYGDSVLEYMVHFQNTGSWYAQNIVVIDTLDNNLEWTSLKPTYYSANCVVTVSQVGTYKIAKFTFNNINLPAQSMDDLRSNGMFTYKIKTKSGLAMGTQFRNRASIYFDYNEPILTNTTLNTIAFDQSVANFSGKYGSFVIYPNPASQSFNSVINSDDNTAAEMILCDVTGKILMNKTVALHTGTQTINTDASQLAPGLYFVTLNQNGKIATQKLVIMK
jgi:uncharacterized repeat protein (TIGR01451 family)